MTPSGPASEADLLAREAEDRAFELIDGELIEKEAGFRHGQAQAQLARHATRFHRGGGGDRRHP